MACRAEMACKLKIVVDFYDISGRKWVIDVAGDTGERDLDAAYEGPEATLHKNLAPPARTPRT